MLDLTGLSSYAHKVGRFCAATVVYFYSGLWWIIAPALTLEVCHG